MSTNETVLSREMKNVQNYGFVVLVAILALHILVLGALRYFEMNELKSELLIASESLPVKTSDTKQVINLPDDIIALHTDTLSRTGFYEIRTDKDYIAYASPKNNYILTKSEDSIQHEFRNSTIILTVLYFGEVVLLVGWWFFVKSRVRELFEVK